MNIECSVFKMNNLTFFEKSWFFQIIQSYELYR